MERGPAHRIIQELRELLLNNNHLLSFSSRSIPFEVNRHYKVRPCFDNEETHSTKSRIQMSQKLPSKTFPH